MSTTKTCTTLLAGVTTALALTGCAGRPQPQVTVIQQVPASASSPAGAPVTVTATPAPAARTVQAPAPAAAPRQAPAPARAQDPEAVSLQQALRGLDYDVAVTGVLDTQTAAAVRRFQRNHGLTTDGWAGPRTWAEIRTAQAGYRSGQGAAPAPAGSAPEYGSSYTSTDSVCRELEQSWQSAVDARSKSRSQALHDQAAARGCKPDLWFPDHQAKTRTSESHADGESCSRAELGTVATGSYPNLLCSQVREGVFRWVQSDY